MAATLLGWPSKSTNGAIEPIELGEVQIAAEPAELRALANHLFEAARALESGVSDVEAFSFRDAEAPRDTPSQVIVVARRKE